MSILKGKGKEFEEHGEIKYIIHIFIRLILAMEKAISKLDNEKLLLTLYFS